MLYDIRTDAELSTDIEAKTVHDAIRQFVADKPLFRGVTNLTSFRARIHKIGEGAWAWINCDGERVETIGEVP